MTLHYPETDAAPTTYAPSPNTATTDYGATHVAATEETIVPVYARKAPKRSPKKMVLWAIPAVVALGVAVAAMTMGESSRQDVDPADTDGLTTSRLSATTTEAPAATPTELAVQSTPSPNAVAPAAAPSLRPAPAAAPAPARVTRSTTTTTRRAPVRSTAPAPAPTKAAPLPQETLAPVIVETTPPASVAPTPVLPTEPQPVTPPATTTGPGEA